MATLRITLHPLDVLFFRDGRPFEPLGIVVSGLPKPQTILGALRSALLEAGNFNFKRFDGAGDIAELRQRAGAHAWVFDLRIRYLAIGKDASEFLPAPHNLRVFDESTVVALLPAEDAGFQLSGGLVPMLPAGEAKGKLTKREGSWVKASHLDQAMRGEIQVSDILPADELYCRETRVGLAMNAKKNSMEEDKVYTARFVRMQQGVHFVLHLDVPDQHSAAIAALRVVRLGGEGRHVSIESKEIEPAARRASPLKLLVTPHVLKAGTTLPDNIDAIASGPAIAISGWDMATNQPRPTRWALPAGAVVRLKAGTEKIENPLGSEDPELGYGLLA